ncbi:MAG: hypothetical protein HOL98_18110 [Gammaproteobacteria bacterium]|jgi:hypothetical protein|nr:hypothetical protein [Gammaproteobacteria bacterium]MBT5205381.1 hypothetical protein [Gammaproteobacteria bacterium]MBT5603457.1 hypothetical protein [Gammaproteobacteria bacterium]MBT6245159.1 hypothetical protein [Gammaproteobacteria bacterium]
MTVNTWQPAAPQALSSALLEQLLAVLPNQELTDIENQIPSADIDPFATLMKSGGESWKVADILADDDIKRLVIFLTLAEQQLSGWEAGKLSPVIDLVRILKQREAFDPELRKWIKANTDNRYLPNGPVL